MEDQEGALNAPFVTEKWQASFTETVLRVALTQLVPERDAYRLLAVSCLSSLVTHQLLSEFAGDQETVPMMREMRIDLEKNTSIEDMEPLTLAEMTVAMEMCATVFALLEARRAEVCPAVDDLPTKAVAPVLLGATRWACEKGGQRTMATALHGVYGFKRLRGPQP